MYILKNPEANGGIRLLTSLTELTQDMLNDITKNITIRPHYNIVLLAYKTSLFNLASANGKLDNENISVTPIIAKRASDSAPVKGSKTASALTTPIIAPSAIERGHEIFIPVAAHINNVIRYINENNDFRISLFQKKYDGNLKANNIVVTDATMLKDNNTKVYCFAFKVIADTDIVAEVPLHQTIEDFSYVG